MSISVDLFFFAVDFQCCSIKWYALDDWSEVTVLLDLLLEEELGSQAIELFKAIGLLFNHLCEFLALDAACEWWQDFLSCNLLLCAVG